MYCLSFSVYVGAQLIAPAARSLCEAMHSE